MPYEGLENACALCAGMGAQSSLFELQRKAERSLEDFDKVSLITEDQAFGFRHGEILKRLQSRSQTHPAALICERLSNGISRHAISLVPSSGENIPRDVRSTAE
jgi:hypothetical protein